MSKTGITVSAWDPAQRIVTLDVYGQQTQADVPATVVTQDDWMAFLAETAQPVVDALIKQDTYDPMPLVQNATDLSSQILTVAESQAMAAILAPPVKSS